MFKNLRIRLFIYLGTAADFCFGKFSGFLFSAAIFSLSFSAIYAQNLFDSISNNPDVTLKKIMLKKYPTAYNPSILKIDQGILLSFRYSPEGKMWISYIGLVLLNDKFELISEPQLLSMGESSTGYCSAHHEDARLFVHQGQIFIIYGNYRYSSYDNCKTLDWNSIKEHVEIAKVKIEGDRFSVENLLPLIKHPHQAREKNWVPFEWNGDLFFGYYPVPHEILQPNLMTGMCETVSKIHAKVDWPWGELRGGTPAQLINGEYLTFFHSSINTKSSIAWIFPQLHYFMGAYTFSSQPPFEITKISSVPLKAAGMYTKSGYSKSVIFPGGFVVMEQDVYIAYGRDDCEIWIAKISQEKLIESLIPVSSDETIQ